MTFCEKKAIVSCFYDGYNHKDIEKSFDDFIAPDLVNHTMGGALGRDNWLAFDKAFLAAVPDLKLVVKEQFSDNNRVVTHWKCAGTHQGEFMGMAASGNTIELEGISIDEVEDGKIREHFAMADFTKFMQQFASRESVLSAV